MIKLHLHDTESYRTFDWNHGFPSLFAYQVLQAKSSTEMSEVDPTVVEGPFL